MKKFRLLGILFAVLMVLGLTRVNAASMSSSDKTTLNNVASYSQSLARSELGLDDITVSTSVKTDGQTVDVTVESSSMGLTITFPVTLKNNILTYNAVDVNNEGSVIPFLVAAVLNNSGEVKNASQSDANNVINNISGYSFSENGIEGTTEGGNLTYLKADVKTLKLSGGYSSSTTTTETTTTTTETTDNPKTGVFVPVVGLSVLIVASVVCLVWISKKNVFKGF